MRCVAAICLGALSPAVASAQGVTVPMPGSSSDDPGVTVPHQRAAVPSNVSPFGRAIDLTVNIQFYKKDLGETRLHLDQKGNPSFAARDFVKSVSAVLNDDGRQKLEAASANKDILTPDDLTPIGIDVRFDSENVSLMVSSIDPAIRRLVSIYKVPDTSADRAVNAQPAHFSFFLDTSISESRQWSGRGAGFRDPSIFFNSAARLGDFVLEGAGQFADRNPGSDDKQYRFDRNFVRLVYDLPKIYVRSFLGDLTPEVRFQQNFVQMGGFGISRQKRRFDAFRTAILQGNRQLLLQRESTVEVYRNGALFQQLQLAPGAYDLGNLPLLSGSNDIRLSVRDESGVAQTINYQTYLDPIDLEPGDYEAGGYIGKLATRFGLSPKYDGEIAFTGFYRKAFRDHPAVGVGLQLSKSVQQVSGQTQFLIGSGRLDLTAAASRSTAGTGYFGGASYDLALDQSNKATSLSLQATFQSLYFTGLGAELQENSTIANASAILSHTFNPSFAAQGGASYILNRKPEKNSYRIFAEAYYELSREWFVRGGVDYQKLGSGSTFKHQDGFGFNLALVWRPSVYDRAEARYDYHVNNTQLSYEHSPDGYVGAVGYGAVASRSDRQVAAQGYGNYLGNRFTASLSHSLSGNGFGQITDRQVTTARISTAIAFADGAFAVTRRVGDSFAILTPHASLKGHPIIVGQLLTDDRYRSRSGALGGAVSGNLSSYVTQSVEYDVEDPPAGYDVGEGVFRVRPPYHSGYRLVVGNDAFVTAMGTLVDKAGKPVALTSGEASDTGRPEEKIEPFFTNSVGRFALPGLRPNDHYRVKLSTGQLFEFTVPADSNGLVDLQSVTIDTGK